MIFTFDLKHPVTPALCGCVNREDAAAGQLGTPGTHRSVYLAAAARGLRAAEHGDRVSCQLPSCPLQPDQLLLRFRAAENATS